MTSAAQRSVLVIGASRGIGRQIALTFSGQGYGVGVAAKTVAESDKLPGSIHSVVKEITDVGGKAIPLQCNVRELDQIDHCVDSCIKTFGSLDCVIYNAGAILWKPVKDTPMKKFDLMLDVNTRGSYRLVERILPYFLERKHGKIILVSPPIYNRFFKGKTPYSMTKVPMTVLTHGLANELKDTGVTISSLWPATTIESHVTIVKQLPAQFTRKSTIFADACLAIADEKSEMYNGKALIDEDLLRSTGVKDFSLYRSDLNAEPPRIMPKKFPCLLVEEEDQDLSSLLRSKL